MPCGSPNTISHYDATNFAYCHLPTAYYFMTWPPTATIHGIRMQLSHFIKDVPVYWYQINGVQFNYINHNLKPEDLS